MEHAIERARDRQAAAERDAVAEEIRNSIARSGMSHTRLASCLGTSTPRLSTYATGNITPSATLMVRLRHVLGEESESSTTAESDRDPE